jgi:hypothetical protein
LDAPRQHQLRQAAAQCVAHLAWGAVCESFETVLRDAALHPTLPSALALPTQKRLPHAHLGTLR